MVNMRHNRTYGTSDMDFNTGLKGFKLGRCEASWGEPERDMMVSVLVGDSVSPKRIDLKTL